jgi:carboxymethylenebutenolidase
LKENGVSYQMYMYEGTNHGFHNDTTPRYDEAAAKLAWQRTLELFNKQFAGLKSIRRRLLVAYSRWT